MARRPDFDSVMMPWKKKNIKIGKNLQNWWIIEGRINLNRVSIHDGLYGETMQNGPHATFFDKVIRNNLKINKRDIRLYEFAFCKMYLVQWVYLEKIRI